MTPKHSNQVSAERGKNNIPLSSSNSFTLDYHHLDNVKQRDITRCTQVLTPRLMKAIVIVVLIHILKAIVSALNGSVSRSDNHYEWWNDCCATTEPGSWLIWIKFCHQKVWFWLMIASCPHHLKLAPAGQWFLIQAASPRRQSVLDSQWQL